MILKNMNYLSNFLRSYSPHGRHAMLIAFGDMFLSIVALANCLPNLNKDNIDLTSRYVPDKEAEEEMRNGIFTVHLVCGISALFAITFGTFLGMGIIKRSPRWTNVWIVVNMIIIFIGFGGLIVLAWGVPILMFTQKILPMSSAVIYRSLQCWSVQEFHWEIKSRKMLIDEEKNNICFNCENNVAAAAL